MLGNYLKIVILFNLEILNKRLEIFVITQNGDFIESTMEFLSLFQESPNNKVVTP